MRIRPETTDDHEAIHRVVIEAFGRRHEADLVSALRISGDLEVSLVAVEGGTICGHVALSRMKSPERSLALAPIAVSPGAQRHGTGSALVREALSTARRLGHDLVFVVGEPRFYQRFGFSPDIAARFPCRFAGPYFMAMPLSGLVANPAPVIYADAFQDLE
jgi:putative acetyltransferase